MTRYHDIVLGGGAAGLSLAYQLSRACPERRILLIDRAPKQGNDRTWCFWEREPGPFEAVVHARWQRLRLDGQAGPQTLEIAPYTYKMIRSGDFYDLVNGWLERCPQVTRLYGHIEGLEDSADGVQVQVDGQRHAGDWAYSSLLRPGTPGAGLSDLLQHFRGWVIETEHDAFDPQVATFMDFRMPQGGDTRFVYALPQSKTRALIEYTLFSSALLPDAEYDAGLEHYLSEVLGLGTYRILEREQGVIPMTDAPFELHPSPHVLNIGTAGGCAKPSTGYTFRRIQRQTAQIVQSLRQSGHPLYPTPRVDHFRWMDSVMLRVMATGRQGGAQFFQSLFRRNPVGRVLAFLNEESRPQDDLALMLSVNIPLFVGTGLEVSVLGLTRTLGRGARPLPSARQG